MRGVKKFDNPFVFTVKAERADVEAAREKAKADGRTLNKVISDFLGGYTITNSTAAKLEVDVTEQRQVAERERIKLMALEARLRQKTGDIPEEYIDYYRKKSPKWNEAQRITFVDQTAKKLKLDPGWLREKTEELAKEGAMKTAARKGAPHG